MIRKILKRVALVVILAGLIYGFYHFTTENIEKDENLYYGEVEYSTYDVYATVPGILKDIGVAVGDRIEMDQAMALLDSDQAMLQYEQVSVAKSIADENIVKSETPATEEELNMQEYAIKQLESQKDGIQDSINGAWNMYNQSKIASEGYKEAFELQETNYSRIKTLYDSGIETKVNMDAASLALVNSRNAYESSQMDTSRIYNEISNLKNQMEAIDAQIAAAREQLNRMYEGYEEVDRKIVDLAEDKAALDVEISGLQLDKYTIKSYNTGVVEDIYYEKGEFINAGSPLLTLYDPEMFLVTIYVSEEDLMKVETGSELEFRLAVDKEVAINGRISRIATEAMFTPVNIVTEEDRGRLVYEVEVELEPVENMRSGMLLVTDFRGLE